MTRQRNDAVCDKEEKPIAFGNSSKRGPMPTKVEAIKQKVAGRILVAIVRKAGSAAAFRTAANAANYSDIAKNFVKWIPPVSSRVFNAETEKWTKKKGSRAAEVDWDSVHTPSGRQLRDFCEFTGANAHQLLFGGRPDDLPGAIAHELRPSVLRALQTPRGRKKEHLKRLDLMPDAILPLLTRLAAAEVERWQDYYESNDRVGAALSEVDAFTCPNAHGMLFEIERERRPRTELIIGPAQGPGFRAGPQAVPADRLPLIDPNIPE